MLALFIRVSEVASLAAQALEAGAGGSNPSYVNMLWLLLRMRQACSHPWYALGLRCGG